MLTGLWPSEDRLLNLTFSPTCQRDVSDRSARGTKIRRCVINWESIHKLLRAFLSAVFFFKRLRYILHFTDWLFFQESKQNATPRRFESHDTSRLQILVLLTTNSCETLSRPPRQIPRPQFTALRFFIFVKINYTHQTLCFRLRRDKVVCGNKFHIISRIKLEAVATNIVLVLCTVDSYRESE